jgi:hypothetical protein
LFVRGMLKIRNPLLRAAAARCAEQGSGNPLPRG